MKRKKKLVKNYCFWSIDEQWPPHDSTSHQYSTSKVYFLLRSETKLLLNQTTATKIKVVYRKFFCPGWCFADVGFVYPKRCVPRKRTPSDRRKVELRLNEKKLTHTHKSIISFMRGFTHTHTRTRSRDINLLYINVNPRFYSAIKKQHQNTSTKNRKIDFVQFCGFYLGFLIVFLFGYIYYITSFSTLLAVAAEAIKYSN